MDLRGGVGASGVARRCRPLPIFSVVFPWPLVGWRQSKRAHFMGRDRVIPVRLRGRIVLVVPLLIDRRVPG